MTQVNKRKIPEHIRREAWGEFVRMVRAPRTGEALLAALRALFTPTELITLEKRLAIRVLLARGWSYRKIGHAIDVTRPTVSAVKRGMGIPPKKARPYTPIPRTKRNENHWLERERKRRVMFSMNVLRKPRY